MSTNLKSPPEGLKNVECKKGTPPVRPPILCVPPTDFLEKQEMEQIKVELLDETKFQMPTYGSGINEEYLVHVIAFLHLDEQKRTAAEVKEAFAALVAARKERALSSISLKMRLWPQKKQQTSEGQNFDLAKGVN